MLDQQLSVSLRIRSPQLSHLDPPILAALMVSNTTHESLWDITHRICDRYLGALQGKNQVRWALQTCSVRESTTETSLGIPTPRC